MEFDDGSILVCVRNVMNHNLEFEFNLIRSVIDDFPFVSIKTEFPGILFPRKDGERISNYSILKQNVDASKLIQLGLTLTDFDGNLPALGKPRYGFAWQFNFREFNISRDRQVPKTVELMRKNGMYFERSLIEGVNCKRFSELMMSSGLVCNGQVVTWVTFHSAYDFGYLIKVLSQQPLPTSLEDYMALLAVFFGDRVFDVKYMTKFCSGLYGGLDKIAMSLHVEREVRTSRKAGSTSLLTWRVFQKIRDLHFTKQEGGVDKFAGLLYGLEPSSMHSP